MKATDFDLAKDLKFDLQAGKAALKNHRLVILDANAMGLLQAEVAGELGMGKGTRSVSPVRLSERVCRFLANEAGL